MYMYGRINVVKGDFVASVIKPSTRSVIHWLGPYHGTCMSLQKVSGLSTRPLYKASLQGLSKRPLYKASLQKASLQGLSTWPLYKASLQGLSTRPLYKVSGLS